MKPCELLYIANQILKGIPVEVLDDIGRYQSVVGFTAKKQLHAKSHRGETTYLNPETTILENGSESMIAALLSYNRNPEVLDQTTLTERALQLAAYRSVSEWFDFEKHVKFEGRPVLDIEVSINSPIRVFTEGHKEQPKFVWEDIFPIRQHEVRFSI